MLNDIVKQALPGLETIFVALGSWALACAAKWISAHAKNATIAGIMTRTTDLVSVVVAEANQVVVDGLKSGNALTPARGEEILGDVLAKLKAHLGPKGIAELEKVVQPGQLQSMLVSLIEAEVAKQKQFGPIDIPPPVAAVVPAVAS